jgi:N-acetylmuramoyl-L-alanine amidase
MKTCNPTNMIKSLALALVLALLGGCAAGPRIDNSYSSLSHSSRVRFIVLHYTVSDLADSLKTLTQQEVSSHYLLSDEASPRVFALVDETRQAGHAGVSSWKTYTHINNSSIGIEIVNPGYRDTPQGRLWQPYPPAQVEQLILLLRQIVARHDIKPENILGHSDIAPQRKLDPGPLFPWQQLAAAGLAQWPDALRVASRRPAYEGRVPDISWFQKRLKAHGFAVPENGALDLATRNVMIAFQMKYRPAKYDGEPDAETAAILDVLTSPAPMPWAANAIVLPACGEGGEALPACVNKAP